MIHYDTAKAEEIVMDTIGKKATVQKSKTYNAEECREHLIMVLNIASQNTLNEEERTNVL